MRDAMSQLAPSIIELVIALVALAVGYARSGLRELIAAKTSEGVTRKALLITSDTVMSLVMQAQQTIVSELRKDLADGKITPEEFRNSLRVVRDSVLVAAKGVVGDKLGAALGISSEAVGELLEAKIEAAVPVAKSVSGVSPKIPT